MKPAWYSSSRGGAGNARGDIAAHFFRWRNVAQAGQYLAVSVAALSRKYFVYCPHPRLAKPACAKAASEAVKVWKIAAVWRQPDDVGA